jgi:hypothetical protein
MRLRLSCLQHLGRRAALTASNSAVERCRATSSRSAQLRCVAGAANETRRGAEAGLRYLPWSATRSRQLFCIHGPKKAPATDQGSLLTACPPPSTTAQPSTALRNSLDEGEQRPRVCEAPGGSGSRFSGDTPAGVVGSPPAEVCRRSRRPGAPDRRARSANGLVAGRAVVMSWREERVSSDGSRELCVSGSRTRLRDATRPLLRSEQDSCAPLRPLGCG